MEESKLGVCIVHNFVCSLTKTTKKSMVRVVNGLVRKIKSLQHKEDEKNVKKSNRFLEEVQFLKKTHAKEVTIFALKNIKKVEEVVSTQKRVLVRVASDSLLAKEIDSFREKYPNWRSELPIILSTLGKKWKANKKVKIPSEKEKTKKSSAKEELHLEKDKPSSKTKDKKQPKEPTNEPKPKEEPTMATSTDMSVSLAIPVDRKEGELEVKKLNLDESFDEEEEKEETMDFDQKPANNEEPSTRIKDSFFLGGDSEDDSAVESDIDDSHSFNDHRNSSSAIKKRNGSPYDHNKSNKRFSSSWNDNRGRGSSKGRDFYENKPSKGLHPSWAAKKEVNKSSIQEFKGKKTVFGEGGTKFKSMDKGIHPSWTAKKEANKSSIQEFKGKKTVFGEEGSNTKFVDKSIHPSWAAKKEANKSSIQEFKGKKTVFEDEGTSKTLDKDIHPSWAAKKEANKSSIQEFQGTKIVFDD